MANKFKLPSKKQPVFSLFKKVVKTIIWRKLEVIIIPKEVHSTAIFVGNHAAKKGPMAYELGLPVFNVKWGAHEMLGNYRSRRKYLKDIFYIKKHGWSKKRATFRATFEAIFSKMMYKGIKVIGTYTDIRLKNTLRDSIKILENDMAILIFPEDSNSGYHTLMKHFFSGFVMLSEQYYKKHQIDLPIYPVYYSDKCKKIIVGHPLYVQDLVKQGYKRDEIASICKDKVNELYLTYFNNN